MKYIILSISMVLLGTCACSNKKSIEQNDVTMISLEIVRPDNISEYARRFNMGSDDNPVFVWVEITGNLELNGKIYPHILGLRYTYENGGTDTSFYETSGRRDLNYKPSDVSALWHPGSTIRLMGRGYNDSILFNVLEVAMEMDGEDDLDAVGWRIVPTCRKNRMSGAEVHVQIKKTAEKEFLVILMDGQGNGYKRRMYKTDNDKIDENMIISFFDWADGKIYFIDKDCFIEPLDKIEYEQYRKSVYH